MHMFSLTTEYTFLSENAIFGLSTATNKIGQSGAIPEAVIMCVLKMDYLSTSWTELLSDKAIANASNIHRHTVYSVHRSDSSYIATFTVCYSRTN